MKKYSVLVTRNTTESARVVVVAKDAKEALQRAVMVAHAVPQRWEPDDATGEPYIGDPDQEPEEIAP